MRLSELSVGLTVTRRDTPPTEHGVVTLVGTENVTVHWHLKQDTDLGPAGMSTGKPYENPSVLVPDRPCPHCPALLKQR
jgi:hypothetical protein